MSNIREQLLNASDWLFGALGIDRYPTWPVQAKGDNEVSLVVPGYRQTQQFTCGYVAALSVVHAFRPKFSAERLYRVIEPDEEYGAETVQVRRGLKAAKIGSSVRRNLTFSAISAAINDGFPIITLVKRVGMYHWVVIYGVGRRPNRVFVTGDQLLKSTCRDWADFRRKWVTGFGIVCWGK